MIEMVIVLVIIGILTAFTAMSLLAPRKYKAEDQALVLIDVLREAQQRALSEKKIMKVEIDSANRVIRLINENEPADVNNDNIIDTPTAANDVVIKTVVYNSDQVFIGLVPTNMSANPIESSPVTAIPFSSNKAVLRFKSNGTVHNAGTNSVGAGSIATGRTIYVWTKKDSDSSATPTIADVLRAVTVIGSSGSTKLWKCATGNGQCTTWTK